MSLFEESEFRDAYSNGPASAVTEVPALIPQSQGGRRSDLTWNVLTVLVWLMIAFIVMAFISIYSNPASALNPLQPYGAPTLAAAVVIPTEQDLTEAAPTQATALARVAITTTAVPSTVTATVVATATLEPTETATPGPSPTATIHSLYPFMRRGEAKAIDGATFHINDECRLWVAGQAYDLQGAPMVGITVSLGGTLDRKYINQLSLTGTALQYGQAGYEFTIAEQPIKSTDAMWVQLFDQAMIPLSNRVFFNTFDDCSQNLILINFRQVR